MIFHEEDIAKSQNNEAFKLFLNIVKNKILKAIDISMEIFSPLINGDIQTLLQIITLRTTVQLRE